jgi:hypothetical protein
MLKLALNLEFQDFTFIAYEPVVKYVVNTFILINVSEDATLYGTLFEIDRGQPELEIIIIQRRPLHSFTIACTIRYPSKVLVITLKFFSNIKHIYVNH